MAFIVVHDANVLYPSTLRDLLIRIAQAGLVQAKWTDEILDEVFDNLIDNRPDLDPGALARTRELMVQAVRDCLVTDYELPIEPVELPDPDDRVLSSLERDGLLESVAAFRPWILIADSGGPSGPGNPAPITSWL